MVSPDTNGWSRAELFVKETLERHTEQLDRVDDRINKMDRCLARLSTRVTFIVSVGFIIATGVASIVATAIAHSLGG